MPHKYLALVEHDLRFIDLITSKHPPHIENEDFSDWKVTLMFYVCCVYLKAVCVSFGENVQDHYSLRQILNSRPEIWSIAKHYRHIEEASRDARYEGRKFDQDYILNRLLPKFIKVRDQIVKVLKSKRVGNIPVADPEPFLRRTPSHLQS